MRDVHDGIGGNLVSTLAMVENRHASVDQVAAALRSSLDEMRIVIDSLDPMIDDLNILLGSFRGRMEPRIRSHGLRFSWEISDLPVITRLGSHEYLQILRIMQEAVTNVIKHAKAKVIRVQTGVRSASGRGPGVFIAIQDDGVGLGERCQPGRGHANMSERASQIGALLRIVETDLGTLVDLWIPIDAADAPTKKAPGGSPQP
jgi:signal transduction histidine kinase